jgi:hypothetical protein
MPVVRPSNARPISDYEERLLLRAMITGVGRLITEIKARLDNEEEVTEKFHPIVRALRHEPRPTFSENDHIRPNMSALRL